MGNDKLKAILTGRITVGIVCFLLGGIIFGNKSGVNITQERYDQLVSAEKKVAEQAVKDAALKQASKDSSSDKNKDNKVKQYI
jgi:hypothetical protein